MEMPNARKSVRFKEHKNGENLDFAIGCLRNHSIFGWNLLESL